MSKPDWIPFENNYVIVTEFDSSAESAEKYKLARRGPLVGETYIDEAKTLRRAFEKVTSPYGGKQGYGRVTIARLSFEDIPIDMLMTELARQDEPT